MPKLIDLTGQRFAELTVERVADTKIKNRPAWVCRCDCGEYKTVAGEALKSGAVKCCGRHKTKTYLASLSARSRVENRKYPVGVDSHSRLYTLWRAIFWRCTNPTHAAYNRYGGRGITICADWHTFAGFLAWALPAGYRDDLTLDRINNDRGYEPGNCRWATRSEQARNRRSNTFISAFGESKLLVEWAEDPRCRVSAALLSKRIAAGHTPEFAMTATEYQARHRASVLREAAKWGRAPTQTV